MRLELEVLASTSIKRKKPWPKLAFLGEVQESIFLIDDRRASILYLPSGKTKKKIPRLQSVISDAATVTYSDNGHFILGLMCSGDLFLWHKDTDLLKFIPGLPDLCAPTQTSTSSGQTTSTHTPIVKPTFHLCVADDGSKLVAIVNSSAVYVWELDPNAQLFHSPGNTIKGTWSRVSPTTDTILPQTENLEASVHGLFMIPESLGGLSCELSFTFNHNRSVCVTSVLLVWHEVQDVFAYRCPTFSAQWNTLQYRLSSVTPRAEPIRVPGAYRTRHAHNSNLLAVAVNQFDTYKNKMMFVSTGNDTVIVADMKGMGTKTAITKHSRSHWVSDLCWTADDLFVVCITYQGSVCILTRLGEPLMLQSFGCNIEMGPKPFLPLHPLISVRAEEDSDLPETEQSALAAIDQDLRDPLHQRFSVVAHPRLPLLLVSDGYMVMAIQLPGETTCLSLMKGLVTKSNCHLRRIRDKQKIQMSLFDSLKKQGVIGPRVNMKTGRLCHRLGLLTDENTIQPSGSQSASSKASTMTTRYSFEEEEEDTGLDTTQDSEIADFILAGDVNVGKITFGDVENLNTTIDFDRFSQEDGLSAADHMLRAQRALMLAWSLGASHTGIWTSDHEDISHNVVHNLVRLFTCLTHCNVSTLKEVDALQGIKSKKVKDKEQAKKRGVRMVLGLFRDALQLLSFDAGSQHLMVCSHGFIHMMIEFLANNRDLQKNSSHMQALSCCFVLLKYSDATLSRLYSHLPSTQQHCGLSTQFSESMSLDLYRPSVWTKRVSSNQARVMNDDKTNPPQKHHTGVDTDDGYSSQPSARSVQEVPEKQLYIAGTQQKQARLLPVWQLLYKYGVQHYMSLSKVCQTHPGPSDSLYAQLQHTLHLILLVQANIHALGGNVAVRYTAKIKPGDKMYLEGLTKGALGSWTELLDKIPEEKLNGSFGSRVFHALFYTMVSNDQLRSALLLVESLIRHNDLLKTVTICKQNDERKMLLLSLLQQEPDSTSDVPIPLITNKPARQLTQTLARLMAAYFSNGALFVYPPHIARKLPPLNTKHSTNDQRKLPLYHKKLSLLLRSDNLGMIWTPERTLEYLMVSCLYPEAVWFVHELGDWKTTFIMSVAGQLHQKMEPDLYKSKKLQLPRNLTPETILQNHLQAAFFPPEGSLGKDQHIIVDEMTDFDQLTRTLGDILLAATMCDVDLVPWLLDGLMGRLKSLAARFMALVPDGLYLPAPPVYCPQPALTQQEDVCRATLDELQLRRETSSVIILILLVFNSSGTTLPAASHYAQRVLDAFTQGRRLKKTSVEDVTLDIQVLQETYLAEPSRFQGQEKTPSVHTVLSCFRELCSVTWMLYARDKLSLCLRDKAKMSEKKLCKPHSITDDEWLKHCQLTLHWNLELLPFSTFLGGDTDLYGNLLSLILELPQNEDTATVLAEHFSDPEVFDPEIQDKLQWILKEWQGVFLRTNGMKSSQSGGQIKVESPRGTTMSMFFHSNLKQAEKTRKRKIKVFGKYEPNVFVEDIEKAENDRVMSIGSRCFESTTEYLEFLDVFYALSFNRLVDKENEKQSKVQQNSPLLLKYSKSVRKHELESSLPKMINSRQQRKMNNIISIQSPVKRHEPMSSPREVPIKNTNVPLAVTRGKGLFRSRSLVELRGRDNGRSGSPQRRSSISSQDDLVLHMPPSGKSGFRSPRGKIDLLRSPRSQEIQQSKSFRKPGLLDRSLSTPDLKDPIHGDVMSVTPVADPLTFPVIPTWMLDNMNLGKKFAGMEQLLDWLNHWAGHNHTLLSEKNLSGSESSLKHAGLKSAIRVRVPPKVVMYSLWLLENCYDLPPSVINPQVPVEPQEITVMACCSPRLDGDGQPIEGKDVATKQGDVNPKDEKRKKKKRKKKKNSEKNDTDSIDDVDHQQGGNARGMPHRGIQRERYPTNSSTEDTTPAAKPKKFDPRKLSFHLPPDSPEDQRSVGVGSDTTETLSVSSLREEELKQTMEDTMTKLQGASLHVEDLDSESIRQQRDSVDAAMNTTLRFPHKDDDLDEHAQMETVKPVRASSVGNQSGNRNASVQSNDLSGIAQELQVIVRQELRKIMEAQHQGIITMIGALDNDGNNKPVDFSSSNGHIPNGTVRNGHAVHHNDKKYHRHGKRQDCVVMSVQENVKPKLDKHLHSSSEMNVTPLPSGEMSSERPIFLSDLEKQIIPEKSAPQQSSVHSRTGDGSGLNQALKQLKLLEGDATVPMTQQNKENYVPGRGYFSGVQDHGAAPSSTTGANNVPFGHLLSLLKDRDNSADTSWPFVPQHPPFLHIHENQNVHLPQIPRLAWEQAPSQMASSNTTQMPHFPSASGWNYRFEDIAEKDTGPSVSGSQVPHQGSALNNVPFPLLRLNQNSHEPYGFERDQFGVPQLIPPEDVIQFEQHRYQTHILKNKRVRDFVSEQMASQIAAQKQPEPIGKKLLMPDLFEPFGPIDERDKKQRERRRKKKTGESPRMEGPRLAKGKKKKTKVRMQEMSDDESTLTGGTDLSGNQDDLAHDVIKVKNAAHSKLRTRSASLTDDDDTILNHGYALTPGIFDEYLKDQDHLGAAVDTNAKIQYKAAMAVKTKPKTNRRDAGTYANMADKGTSITRDTGTDPVAEAIQKYYRAKTGHTSTILPPDVFLGLRFEDTNKPVDSDGSQPGSQRAFLNVVDINADMLEDLVPTVSDKDDKPSAQRSRVKLPSERVKSPERHIASDEDYGQGHDSITAGLLGKPSTGVDFLTAEDTLYSSRRLRTKDDIRKKLEDMNSQFNAIDTMNANIERDFRDSELLLHTIDQMGKALVPEERVEPPARVLQSLGSPRKQETTPSSSKQKKVEICEPSPRDVSKMEVDAQITEEHPNMAGETLGFSLDKDTMEEVLHLQQHNLARTGEMTPRHVKMLSEHGAMSPAVHLSQEELEEIFSKISPRQKPGRSEEQQKKLQAWMANRHLERQKQYKAQMTQLREAEHHPYKPKTLDASATGHELMESDKIRINKKKEQQEEYTRRRQEEAAQLMGDIMTDHPQLPHHEPVSTKLRGTPRDTTTPRDTRRTIRKPGKGIAGKTVVRKIAGSSRSPSRSPLRDRTWTLRDHRQVNDGIARDGLHMDYSSQPRSMIPKPRQFAEKVNPSKSQRDPVTPRTPLTTSARQRPASPRRLADMVRLQRPHVTRQSHRPKAKPVTYTERLSQLKGEGTTARSTGSIREQQRLYGTQHIPGSRRLERRGPRQVKTYTERLSELKQQAPPVQHFDTVPRRPATAGSVEVAHPRGQDITHRGISPRRLRKTLTYAQQLQQLQPPKDARRLSKDTVTLSPRPGRKWHKAPHEAKSYVEQLKMLQQPSPARHRDAYRGTEPASYRTRPLHSAVRSRPYGDPYSEADDDRLSIVSPWSMDDDVKKLLYDDPNLDDPQSAAATDFDLSALSDIDYFIGDEDDYTQMVDPDELQSVSFSEGSIMSFIDWDQVDQLIADG